MAASKLNIFIVGAALASRGALALPQAASSSSTSSSAASASGSATGTSTGVPSLTLSTAVASPSAALTSDLPSQAALPPVQEWCPSEIFCAGNVCSLLSHLSLSSHFSETILRFCRQSTLQSCTATRRPSSTSPRTARLPMSSQRSMTSSLPLATTLRTSLKGKCFSLSTTTSLEKVWNWRRHP